MEMIEFKNTYILFFLILLPLLAFFWSRKRSGGGIIFSHISNIKAAMPPARVRGRHLVSILKMLAMAVFIIALARPRIPIKETKIPIETVDIVVALDISTSMDIVDMRLDNNYVSRIDIAKSVLNKFVEERPSDRIGLVIFSRYAFSISPSTIDHEYLLNRIKFIQTGMINDGTAIGSAIGTAVNRLKNSDVRSNVIILITDGANNVFTVDPLDAADIAAQLGIKIYTIGVGSKGDKEIPFGRDMFGRTIYGKVPVEIDEKLLKETAEKTRGVYFRAADADSLNKIFNEINELEKTSVMQKFYMQYTELYPYLLIAGLMVMLLQIVLVDTFFRKLP